MKSKKMVHIIIGIIIAIPVIFIIVLVLAFKLKLCMIEQDGRGRDHFFYLAGKEEDGTFRYRMLYIPKYPLAKISKVKKGMTFNEILEVVGQPTHSFVSEDVYNIDKDWVLVVSYGGELHIQDYANGRNFDLEYMEYITTQSYLRGAGAFTGGSDNRPKRSLAKFSKVKIGMSTANVVKLAGKPTDSVDSSFIWYRYKIDKGWYMDLHFFNEKLSDMSIVDFPNNRVFELEQEDYITTLPCQSAIAQTSDSSSTGTFTDDRDGKTYRTVKIGKLTWMAENLNFAADSSACYDNADSNCTKYGRLYNWDAAMIACPAGWRLSSNEDWLNLALAAAGKCNGRIHWNLAGIKLKSTTGWNSRHDGSSGNGTDDFGFSALSGDDRFFGAGVFGNWWSAAERDAGSAGYWSMVHTTNRLYRGDCHKIEPYSVRCVRE